MYNTTAMNHAGTPAVYTSEVDGTKRLSLDTTHTQHAHTLHITNILLFVLVLHQCPKS